MTALPGSRSNASIADARRRARFGEGEAFGFALVDDLIPGRLLPKAKNGKEKDYGTCSAGPRSIK